MYYVECCEFVMGVYKNDGYSKLGNMVILSMDDVKVRYIVMGCVVVMGKNNIEEVKLDFLSKGVFFGMVSGVCYNVVCKVDIE